MGKVITINKKVEFDSNISEVVKTTTRVEINSLKEDIETKVIPLNSTLGEYRKFNMEFYKKFNINGRVNNIPFNSILRKYNVTVLASNKKKFTLALGNVKGTISRAAFRRLRNETAIKCTAIDVDLIGAIQSILSNSYNITVNSGWFSKLGTQLQNALLQGEEVNENADWIKFRQTKGSKLKNVQFRITSDEFSRGYILVSLSSRGFMFTNSSISDEVFLHIVEDIISKIDKPSILSYDGSEDDYDEEVELIDELEAQLDFIEQMDEESLI